MSREMKPPFTKAELARYLSRMATRTAQEAQSLAEGMWNPAFCADDGAPQALDFCDEMRGLLDALERRARAGATPNDP